MYRIVTGVTSDVGVPSTYLVHLCFLNPSHFLEGSDKTILYCSLRVAWWRHQMETISALLAFCVGNSPVTGEFPIQRPVTQSFDVFFDMHLNEQLSKQLPCWWFKTGLLCGEFTSHWWIPHTKASDGELWCFLWSAPEWKISKQSPRWWFKMPSRPLWCHSNGNMHLVFLALSEGNLLVTGGSLTKD